MTIKAIFKGVGIFLGALICTALAYVVIVEFLCL